MDETYFNKTLDEWIEHCRKLSVQIDSSARSVSDCEAYKKIVSMGYKALPLIRRAYEKEDSNNFALKMIKGHGLVAAVNDIIGKDFSIPKEILGRISAMEEYTKRWIDENSKKYK